MRDTIKCFQQSPCDRKSITGTFRKPASGSAYVRRQTLEVGSLLPHRWVMSRLHEHAHGPDRDTGIGSHDLLRGHRHRTQSDYLASYRHHRHERVLADLGVEKMDSFDGEVRTAAYGVDRGGLDDHPGKRLNEDLHRLDVAPQLGIPAFLLPGDIRVGEVVQRRGVPLAHTPGTGAAQFGHGCSAE